MAHAATRDRRSIHKLLITLTAALTMGLVGCAPQFSDPIGMVQFERDSSEPDLVKPPNTNQSIALSEATWSPANTQNLPGEGLDSGMQAFTPTTTASGLADNDDNSSAEREEEEEQDDRDACKEDELFGNLSVEIDGPAAAFVDDNITKAIKIALYNDTPSQANKVHVIVRLSKDEEPDDEDLILTEPKHLVAGPDAFSEQQVDAGALQPLVNIESGKYHIIVSINEQESSSSCFLDDNVASFPLEVI